MSVDYGSDAGETNLIHQRVRGCVQTTRNRVVQDVFESLLLAYDRVQEVVTVYVRRL